MTVVLLIATVVGCAPCPRPTVSTLVTPATPPPVVPQPVLPPAASTIAGGPGPTTMARVSDGYELRNRDVRVVINDRTGDVVAWGTPGQERNTVAGPRGLYAAAAGLPDTAPDGYVEKRDDQTWQFYGVDANGLTWRKVYNLDHDSLLVSFVVQNGRPTPATVAVQLRGDLTGLRLTAHDPEQFTGTGGYGTVSLHGWNQAHGQPPPALPTLIQSDAFPLKPGERQGYTTEWRLDAGR